MATIIPHTLLRYVLVDDYLERRAALRTEHLGVVAEYRAAGLLTLAGALSEPVDEAYLVFRTGDRELVTDFVERDPYVREGLVREVIIRAWSVVG